MKLLRLCGAVSFAACVLALPIVPALADVATSPLANTIIDVGPVLNAVVIPFALAFVSIFATWALSKLKDYLHTKNEDALGDVLEVAMQNGLALAQARIPGLVPASLNVDAKSALVAGAARYVLAHASEAVSSLGITPDALAEKLEARLAVNTTPADQSVAVPTTPAAVMKASPWAVLLGLALLLPMVLTGCDTPSTAGTATAAGGTNQAVAPGVSAQAQSAANTINAGYAIVKGAINIYMALTPCGTAGATALCSEPAITTQLTKALAVADSAVQAAVNAILNPTTDPTSIASLTSDAMSAIGVLTQAAATFGLVAL